jgi:polyisoprenoid-binding protein YceI
VTTATPGIHPGSESQPGVPAGGWRVNPACSHASFTARVAGQPVRGRLPLTGGVVVAQLIEDSAARLVASTSAVYTGSTVLDRLLAGPAFLDADVFPEISFRSELLVWVPTGWRAIGQLKVKGRERALACQLDVGPLSQSPDGPSRMTISSRWVLDSSWITSKRIPALSRRVAMVCSVALEPDR